MAPMCSSRVSVASRRDVNAASFDDLITLCDHMAKSGLTYMIFGAASGFPTSLDLLTLSGTNGDAANSREQSA
jgi:hypothetical protein